jgi:hypothetical protein
MGGFEPPRGQALDLPPLPGLGYMADGPSGWTRTTTSRVKSPACCIDTTERNWSEWSDSNRHFKAWKARGQPLPHIRRTEYGPVSFTGLSTSFSCQRARSLANTLVGSKGFEPKRPRRETVLQTVSGPSARTARRVATVPGFEPGPTRFGGSDAHRYTTLSLSIRSFRRRSSPLRPRSGQARVSRPKIKKAFQGAALEGLICDQCGPSRATYPPYPSDSGRGRASSPSAR